MTTDFASFSCAAFACWCSFFQGREVALFFNDSCLRAEPLLRSPRDRDERETNHKYVIAYRPWLYVQVPDWMLTIKQERRADRQKRERAAPHRDGIGTVSKYDIRRKRRRQFMINDSKKDASLSKKQK